MDLGILLGLSYQVFVDQLRADLHRRGFRDLGGAYGYVFRALEVETLALRQLARRLGMSDQGAAKIIDEMEGRGYVERRPDAGDGRIKQIRLAPRGRAALAAARRFHRLYERRLQADLGRPALATMRLVLGAMIAAAGTDAAQARLRAL